MLTPAEQRLAQVEDAHRGRDLIKQVRLELTEHGRELLEEAVKAILGVGIVSLHSDTSTRTGESIILFTLDAKPTYKPSWSPPIPARRFSPALTKVAQRLRMLQPRVGDVGA